MIQTILTSLILLIPLLSIGQSQSSSTTDSDFVTVYVDSKSKIFLNGEKIRMTDLEKYIASNKIVQAKIGTLKPTPLDVFPTFEKVVQLMKKYEIETSWYSDPEFQIPFFDN